MEMWAISPGTRIQNVFVDFVREAERVEFLTQAGDEFHLSTREDFAGRIVGLQMMIALVLGLNAARSSSRSKVQSGARSGRSAALRPKESRPARSFHRTAQRRLLHPQDRTVAIIAEIIPSV
jgi:hypothetical protein